jgi:Spy/CpxP family protein refolding chaperone
MNGTLRNTGLVMMLLLGAASLAMAQGPGGNSPSGAGRGAATQKGPISSLTPEQQTKIAPLRAAAMEKAAPLRGQLDAKMIEMRQLWVAEKPDRKAIAGKQAEMDAIHQKLRAIWTDFGLEVHALLTPAQRAEWAQGNLGLGWGMGPGMMGAGGPRGGRGAGAGRGPGRGMGGRGMGMGMGQGMEGCPCGCPMCPMNQP